MKRFVILLSTVFSTYGLCSAQTGYIYVHQSAMSEEQSPDFAYRISGANSTPNPSISTFSLNDKPTKSMMPHQITATRDGTTFACFDTSYNASEEWAIINGVPNMYRKKANSSRWEAIAGKMSRIEGGVIGDTTVVFGHDYKGWLFVMGVNNADWQEIYRPPSSNTTMIDFAAPHKTDNCPLTVNTGVPGNKISYLNYVNSTFFDLLLGTDASILASDGDIVKVDMDINGRVYFMTQKSAVYYFQLNYNAGTGIASHGPITRINPVFSANPIYNAANLPTFSTLDIGVSLDGSVLFARLDGDYYAYDFTSSNWEFRRDAPGGTYIGNIGSGFGNEIFVGAVTNEHLSHYYSPYTYKGFSSMLTVPSDFATDEYIRTGDLANAIVIPVTPGTYSIVQDPVLGWTLYDAKISDPTNNSSANIQAKTFTVNVTAGEIVHLEVLNFKNTPASMRTLTGCDSGYVNNFGTSSDAFSTTPLDGYSDLHFFTKIANATYDVNQENPLYSLVRNSNTMHLNWSVTSDHTSGALGQGLFMAINFGTAPSTFFIKEFSDFVPGRSYTIAFYATSLVDANINLPDVKYSVVNPSTMVEVSSGTTGPIGFYGSPSPWRQYHFTFVPDATNAILVLSNAQYGTAGGNDVGIDDITVSLAKDFGDAPDTFNTLCANIGPRHLIDYNVKLGTKLGGKADGQPHRAANRDVDDDGVVETPLYIHRNYYKSPVKATNLTTDPTYVVAWLDYNKNGIFDAGEKSTVITVPANTNNGTFEISFPNYTTNGLTLNDSLYMRVRISKNANLDPSGLANEGEVEDYVIPVAESLPILISSFNGYAEQNQHFLNWGIDADESYRTDLLYSKDGQTWNTIYEQERLMNSDNGYNYFGRFINNDIGNTNLYRLKLTDVTGSSFYSKIVTLYNGNYSTDAITISPNPAATYLKIGMENITRLEHYTLRITNSIGVMQKVPSLNGDVLDISNLNKGLYTISIYDGNEMIYVSKFVKQ